MIIKTLKGIKIPEGNVKQIEVNNKIVYRKQDLVPFYVENIYAGNNTLTLDSTYGMTNVQFTTTPEIESSWTTVTFDTLQKTITIPQGGKVYLRGTNQALNNGNGVAVISCTENFNVGGDATTLLKPEGNVLDLTDRYCAFNNLFNNSKVVDASKLQLPAITLYRFCYSHMFHDCTLLQTAPKILPATILADGCYEGMFYNCTSLTTPPILPATILVNSCYMSIFNNCSKLNKVTALFTDNNADYCLSNWLFNVAQKGTFIYNSKASREVLNSSNIPSGWERQVYRRPIT